MQGLKESELQREHFNKISHKYLTARKGSKHLAYKREWWDHLFRLLEKEKVFHEKSVFLEAMCGNAEISLIFSDRFKNLKFEAYDYSDKMVESARANVSQYGIEVFQADAAEFVAPAKYDVIVLIGGLHHVPTRVSGVMKNIHASLKKNGLFINLEPTHNNYFFRKVREYIYRKNSLFEENTERAFTLSELNEYFQNSGFKIVEQYYPGLLGYILYYNPDAFPILNVGPLVFAKLLSKFDLMLSRSFIGKYFSFATWTIVKKLK
jgi:ubiquinone/menaquinone biosynthesis C-methylase UbiE